MFTRFVTTALHKMNGNSFVRSITSVCDRHLYVQPRGCAVAH